MHQNFEGLSILTLLELVQIKKSALVKRTGLPVGIKKLLNWIPDLSRPDWFSGFAPSPVRSNTASSNQSERTGVFITKKFSNFQIELFIEKKTGNRADIMVHVLEKNEKPKNASIALIRKKGGVKAKYLHKNYEVFNDVCFGDYQLYLKKNAEKKGEYNFSLDREGVHEQDSFS